MSKAKKPTPAQQRVLQNIAAGHSADAHCRSRSDYGGLSGTLVSLRKAGWLDDNGITDAGLTAISASRTSQMDATATPNPTSNKQ